MNSTISESQRSKLPATSQEDCAGDMTADSAPVVTGPVATYWWASWILAVLAVLVGGLFAVQGFLGTCFGAGVVGYALYWWGRIAQGIVPGQPTRVLDSLAKILRAVSSQWPGAGAFARRDGGAMADDCDRCKGGHR